MARFINGYGSRPGAHSISARPVRKGKDTHNWDVRSEQAKMLDCGGFTANSATMASATVKARRVETINGKQFLVIS